MAGWAEAPFKLISDTGLALRPEIPNDHGAASLAKIMALNHNIILRSVNSSYHHCLDIEPGSTQASDFLRFNQSLCEILKHHHDVEEEYFFPELQKLSGDPHIMDTNIEEHRRFHEGLERFERYVYNTSAENYNGEEVHNLLQGFGKTLEEHLHNEIPTLLDLHKFDSAELLQLKKGMEDRGRAGNDKYRHLPLFLGCGDRNFVLDGQVEPFPHIPTLVLYIFKFFFEPRYSGSWAFNPSDIFGEPRSGAVVR